MRVLNLYSGLGGNRKLWEDVDVTAVEKDEEIASVYSELFPEDEVIVTDAMKYLLENANDFDFVWSSPMCQTHSIMMIATRHNIKKYPDMSLYQQIIWLDNFFDGKWIVENVKPYYTPLIHPTKEIGRHLFWSNFRIGNFEAPSMPNFIEQYGKEGSKKMKGWLGLNYEGDDLYYDGNHEPCQVLRNCVHPEIGKYILNCAREIYESRNPEQMTLTL